MTAASTPPADVLAAGGIDPRWSRVVEVGDRSWHLLDNSPSLGTEPVGTLLCVHGNPTWSFLWRRWSRRGRGPSGRGA